jgi:uncharacterized membrane protein
VRIRTAALAERVRNSLFVVPMTFVMGGVVLGELLLVVDDTIGTSSTSLPLGLSSTVESARAVLSTVAGATITVAGIAFSVSLLTIQLASSQYSPRVVTGLFRDPFNKKVMGIVVGTFAYCLIVLRSVKSSLEQQGDPVIPNVSVAVGVLLGLASILAVIAFIDHSAHTMDISKILDVVTDDALQTVDRGGFTDAFEPSRPQQPEMLPGSGGFSVRFDRDGWIQLVDLEALVAVVPELGTVRLDVAVGRYVISGSSLCTIWPSPDDAESTERRARGAVHVGETRTVQQDASYGVRQLVDVALKALSPGVNDPTTAQDAIFHLAAVLRASLAQDEPARDLRYEDRRVVLGQGEGHAELLALAYDELRQAAATYPAVVVYLLESMALVRKSLPDEARNAKSLLGEHARLLVGQTYRHDLSDHDRQHVERIYAKHSARAMR